MLTTATNSLHSLGHACALLQVMPGKLRSAVESLGIKPACYINGAPHFDEADLERVRDYLAKGAK